MKNCSDLIFIHKGYNWYLPFVLNQAKFIDSKANITLLGDNLRPNRINPEYFKDLNESQYSEKFIDKYLHRSTNTLNFELFCWLRWLYLLEYMRANSIESVFHLDFDVLLFSPLDEIKFYYSDVINDCGYSIPEQKFDSMLWSASAHISYWTYERLGEFCKFAIETFRNNKYLRLYEGKWEWHQKHKIPGGICDMTTFYLFWLEKSSTIANLSVQYNNQVFDDNINLALNYKDDEFEMSKGVKKISFVDGNPMLTTSAGGKKVRLHDCHFQAAAKQYIPSYYQGKDFKGKTATEISRNIRNFAKSFLRNSPDKIFSRKIIQILVKIHRYELRQFFQLSLGSH